MGQVHGVSRVATQVTRRSPAAVRWLPVLDSAAATKSDARQANTAASSGLPVSVTLREQNCDNCAHRTNCWGAGDEALVALNLLVCRIKFGTKRDNAAAQFLERIAPKIADLAAHVHRQLNGKRPKSEIEQYLSGQAIVHLLKTYQIEAVAYPLQFLFGQFGAVFFDAHGIVKKWISTDKYEIVAATQAEARDIAGDRSQVGSIDLVDPDLLRAAGHHDVDAHAEMAPDASILAQERSDVARSIWRTGLAEAGLTARQERVMRYHLWLVTEYESGAQKRMRSDFATKELGISLAEFDNIAASAIAKVRSAVDPETLRRLLA